MGSQFGTAQPQSMIKADAGMPCMRSQLCTASLVKLACEVDVHGICRLQVQFQHVIVVQQVFKIKTWTGMLSSCVRSYCISQVFTN